MKSTGIIRAIDELGRFVIPKEMRTHLDIKSGDLVEISIDGGRIILAKYQTACAFCGDNTEVVEIKGKRICKKCLTELKEG